jgi:hypothetical protein
VEAEITLRAFPLPFGVNLPWVVSSCYNLRPNFPRFRAQLPLPSVSCATSASTRPEPRAAFA